MSFRVRPALPGDLKALYELAKLTGEGFTNLPADRTTLADKLARCAAALARRDSGLADDLFVMVLENPDTGEVRGTAQIFSHVGQSWPFYSYRLTTLTQHSRELGRTARAEMLFLVTDLEGSSEVGGLFLHPAERAGGLGLLLARSRYLFIAMHRARFAERTLAELRGIVDERGRSPFWDGVTGKFFGMTFAEADRFNALRGNQFIADLMPKHPVYADLLPDSARAVIGFPHTSGRAAMRMLEDEGFSYDGYIDIFDGGPTMTARTDSIRSVSGAQRAKLVATDADAATPALIASGNLAGFRCCLGEVSERDGGIAIDSEAARVLGVSPGDDVWRVAR